MKKILIIDDDHVICEMLKYLFEHRGYEVNVAVDFKKILDHKTISCVDIILLDKRLGEIDGTVICETLKKALSTIPIIMMSASDSVKNICLNSGADDFIEKPFDIKTILYKTELLLSRNF